MKTKVFAHRGASKYAPENTMEAFRLANEMGADGLELDIHMAKDGQIVVIHDHTIDRTSNGQGQVAQMTYEELLKVDSSYKFAEQYNHVKIPLLEEVLAFVKETDLILNIEIKFSPNTDDDIEEKTVELIKKFDLVEQIIISSFNHMSLAKIKRIYPELVTAPLYSCGLYHPWEYAKTFDATGLHPNGFTVNEELMVESHKNGVFVNVWTIDEPSHMEQLINIQADGIITNVPDVARKLIDQR